MKLHSKVYDVQDELTDNQFHMELNDEDESLPVIFMTMLERLYREPAPAMLRELITNAVEAHQESGETRPVDVTIPDAMKMTSVGKDEEFFIIIRDYGPGLSCEQFQKVFTTYVASTKRFTNETTGGFGVGAKSPFAVVDRYFVTSIHEGVEYSYELKKTRGKNVVTLLHEVPTNAPSGLEVKVPLTVASLHLLTEAQMEARNFWFGFNPDQLNITYLRPATSYASEQRRAVPITGTVHNSKRFTPVMSGMNLIGWVSVEPNLHARGQLVAVVGHHNFTIDLGKKYPATEEEKLLRAVTDHQFNIVLNLPISSVDIPASRDTLTMSERTWEAVHHVVSQWKEAYPQHVSMVLSQNHDTLLGAFRSIPDYLASWANDGYSWRGEPFPPFSDIHAQTLFTEVSRNSEGTLHTMTRRFKDVKHIKDFTHVVKTDTLHMQATCETLKKRTLSYLRAMKKTDATAKLKIMVLDISTPLGQWLADHMEAPTVGADFFKVKQQKSSSVAKTVLDATFYTYTVTDGGGVCRPQSRKVSELSELENVFYVSKKEVTEKRLFSLSGMFPTSDSVLKKGGNLMLCEMIGAGSVVMFLPANRNLDAVLESLPRAKNLVTVVASRFEDAYTAASQGEPSILDCFLISRKYMQDTVKVRRFMDAVKKHGLEDAIPADLKEEGRLLEDAFRMLQNFPSLSDYANDFLTKTRLSTLPSLQPGEGAVEKYSPLTHFQPADGVWDVTKTKQMVAWLHAIDSSQVDSVPV